jgi:hypothetical protein
MLIENKSSSYPEIKTSKQALYSPYNQLAFIAHSSSENEILSFENLDF